MLENKVKNTEMEGNSTAVLNVIAENKDISSLLKNKKQYDQSVTYSLPNSEASLTPSLESLSTLQGLNISELSNVTDSDLYIKVESPQKILDTLETYITFQITTRVTRTDYSENEYIVRRRYNDFIWLKQKLVESHPFCIIPPLPGKHTLIGQLDRYSKEFILLRMKSLNTFMSRVSQHPILNCNEHFRLFITAKQGSFSAYQKQRNHSESKIHMLSTATLPSVLKVQNIEFDKAKVYLLILSEKLISLEKISNRINKERQDYVKELNCFHPILVNWAATEPKLGIVMRNIAHSVERNISAQNNLIFSYPSVMGNPIKEFCLYLNVVHDVLRRRELYQATYESSMEDLTKCYTEKEKLLSSSINPAPPSSSGISLWKQPTAEDKLEKLGSLIPELLKKAETNQDTLECANECLRSDLQRWHNQKQRILKRILLDFVDKQIEYYTASVSTWEQVAENLTSKKESSNLGTSK